MTDFIVWSFVSNETPKLDDEAKPHSVAKNMHSLAGFPLHRGLEIIKQQSQVWSPMCTNSSFSIAN